MIMQLKIDNRIFENIELKTIDEDGNETWNVTQNLDEFKKVALDTINWQIGQSVQKALGDTQINLSASNAKAVALLAKLISPSSAKLSKLSTKEKAAWDKLNLLANNGYADSDMLIVSLDAVLSYIQKGTEKATRIAQAKTHEEIEAILNNGWSDVQSQKS